LLASSDEKSSNQKLVKSNRTLAKLKSEKDLMEQDIAAVQAEINKFVSVQQEAFTQAGIEVEPLQL